MDCHSTFFPPGFKMPHSRFSSYLQQPSPETRQRYRQQLKMQKLGE
jgi:hypothetical protein